MGKEEVELFADDMIKNPKEYTHTHIQILPKIMKEYLPRL